MTRSVRLGFTALLSILTVTACGTPEQSVEQQQEQLRLTNDATSLTASSLSPCSTLARKYRLLASQDAIATVSDESVASALSVDAASDGKIGTLADCPADYSCAKYGSLCCRSRKNCQDLCIDCAPPKCFGEPPSAGACTNDSPCFPGYCDFSTCTPSSCFCDFSGQWICTEDCVGHCTSIGKISRKLDDNGAVDLKN